MFEVAKMKLEYRQNQEQKQLRVFDTFSLIV